MNTKTIKTTIEDWYDDLVFDLRHIQGNIRAFFTGLGRWFSYFKVLMKVYDFDYSSILEVERHQITRVRDAIVKYQSHVDKDWNGFKAEFGRAVPILPENVTQINVV